jgi:hypothetical protein
MSVLGGPRKRLLLGAAALALAAGVAAFVALRRTVEQALDTPSNARRALTFIAVERPALLPPRWGTADVVGVALVPQGLITAGGRGVEVDGGRPEDWALPSLRASAFTLWRGRPLVALRAGAIFRRGEQDWQELRSGWGTLEVRALAETPAGELLIGARQGLFRAAWAGAELERLDTRPVRALAAAEGAIVAGGEQGLRRVGAGSARDIAAPDPWIDALAVDGDALWAVTAAGLARGPLDGPLTPVTGADDIAGGVAWEGSFLGLTEAPAATLRRITPAGRGAEEPLPAPARRLIAAQGELFADTLEGLFHHGRDGWRRVRAAGDALPTPSAHIGALAPFGDALAVGLFDGGLALLTERPGADGALHWRVVPGSQAWGVNALLSAGGALHVASLRGAARLAGDTLRPLPGPGAAFSLAATPEGLAVGYGQGVLLPGARLLSAFHGLPGNQALALLSSGGPRRELFVGTPSGLGAIEGRRVRFAVVAGEGKLPHPWVTALAASGEALIVGTYGGGLVRRLPPADASRSAVAGRYQPFVETEGLKINTGCLVEAGGRLWAGSDGRGLWRLSRDGGRFERVDALLPSPRVTALAEHGGALWVGTDEGLTRLPLDEPRP